MLTNRVTPLCRYHYDPLDRLAVCTLTEQASSQRFYMKTRLATEIQGAVQRSIVQQEDHLLAQQQRQDGSVQTTLLASDQQRSVLNAFDATQPHPLAYSAYGHRPLEGGLHSLLGFNGERQDPVTGHYLLGNGYRAFNPVLMRFNSPDSWSPFGEGGLNAYGYCAGDPVNRSDPTGHAPWQNILNPLRQLLSRGRSTSGRLLNSFSDDVASRLGRPLPRTTTTTTTTEALDSAAWTDVAESHITPPTPDQLSEKAIQRKILKSEVHLRKTKTRHYLAIQSLERKVARGASPTSIVLAKAEAQHLLIKINMRRNILSHWKTALAKLPPPSYEAPPAYASLTSNNPPPAYSPPRARNNIRRGER